MVDTLITTLINIPSDEVASKTFVAATYETKTDWATHLKKDQTTPQTMIGQPLMPYVAKTANYTLTAVDYTVDCTANTFTITLPTAVSIWGRVYEIKNTGTETITVDWYWTQTIDGETIQTLIQWESVTIQSNWSNRIII